MDSMLATRLKDLRARRGWTQERLATQAGIPLRTIQRYEEGESWPQAESLQALAAAFDVEVSELIHGYSDAQLRHLAGRFVCPTCGAELTQLSYVDEWYGDCEVEQFACGYTRGYQDRPCPKDPAFPAFEDYRLEITSEGQDEWWCQLEALSDAARRVSIGAVRARTREDVMRLAERAYIEARYGYTEAEKFQPFIDIA